MTETNFYSLGFGGKLALGFHNGISSGVVVVEATNPGYPSEQANVEVSSDGVTWTNAGTITQDGQVNLPSNTGCINFVRLTDISDLNTFSDGTADAYDVNGVKAIGEACTPPPTSGGGCTTTISQSNNSKIVTVVSSKTNTGKNKAKKNTGGTNTIVTGPSTSTVNVNVSGSTNTTTGDCCNNCGTGGTNVSIIGNGNNSTNTVTVTNN